MGYTMCESCAARLPSHSSSKSSRSPIVLNKEYATDGCSGKINSG